MRKELDEMWIYSTVSSIRWQSRGTVRVRHWSVFPFRQSPAAESITDHTYTCLLDIKRYQGRCKKATVETRTKGEEWNRWDTKVSLLISSLRNYIFVIFHFTGDSRDSRVERCVFSRDPDCRDSYRDVNCSTHSGQPRHLYVLTLMLKHLKATGSLHCSCIHFNSVLFRLCV